MELIIGRNHDLHHGFSISDLQGNTLLRIDGKKEDSIPVLLLTLDPHTVYGLSHPKIISKILATGPHTLITQKKLAHSLFEHGMKACWGSIRVLNNKFQATIESYYNVKFQDTINVHGESIDITSWSDEEANYATLSYKNSVYVLSTIDINPSVVGSNSKFINISSIKDYVTLVFDDEQPKIDAINSSGAGST